MNDSILRSSLRAFFITMFTVIGLIFGFLFIGIFSGIFSTSSDTKIETTYTPQILPNAIGERKALSSDTPVILKVNVTGIIGADGPSMSSIRDQLIESREGTLKDNRVKGIILNIQTPGGTVVDADGIYRALKHYKEQYKVPIYAYIDGMCASGGMYVASAADKVYASDVSLVGSIGVIAPSFINVSKFLENYGIHSLTLYAGKGKDDLNPLRTWTPEEANNYKQIIQTYYQDFVNIVTTNRPAVDKEKLINDYGANLFPAPHAKQIGYIDQSGSSLNQVLQDITSELGINNKYQFIELSKTNWYKELFSSKNSFFKGEIKHEIQLSPELHSNLRNQFLYLYKP